MKRDSLAAILVGLSCASAVLAMALALLWLSSMREMEDLQGQAAVVNNRRAAAQALVNDAVLYSREHPAMEALLQEFNLRQASTPATNTPPSKTK
jgi:hypothetical protein